MMKRTFCLVLAICALFAALSDQATAQSDTTAQSRMDAALALEHILTQERDRLLAQEASIVDPVWIGSDIDTIQIYSTAQLRDVLRTIAGAPSIARYDDNRLTPAAELIVSMMQNTAPSDRPDQIIDAVMATLHEQAPMQRAAFLLRFDSAIAQARSEFEQALAELNPIVDDPNNPYDTLAVVEGFVMIPNAGIPGHNVQNPILPLPQCLARCRELSWCITVDFQRENNTCYLQDVSGLRADIRYDYGGNPYDHYALIERLER